MTNINNSGLPKNPRGSDTWTDNLTVGESPKPRAVTAAGLDRSSPKTQFAEHLAAQAPKAGAMAPKPDTPSPKADPRSRAAAQPARSQAPKSEAPLRASSAQEPTAPRPTNKIQTRHPKVESSQGSMLRAAPTRMADENQRPAKALENGLRTPTVRSENFKEGVASKPTLNATETPEAESSPIMVPASSILAETTSLAPVEGLPEDLEDWQLRLQQMLASGNPELFMQQSPALALLAGRLEFMEPAQIPAVVAQSPLLQSILSQPQTSDVLQTAMPLEQNLQMLGLAPTSYQAKNAGPISLTGMEVQTPQPFVTLGETLEALGFDTKRIMQEGDLLKDNIGLEGLQTYMQRAERMQSSLDLPVEWPTMPQAAVPVLPQQKPGVQAPIQGLDPALMAQLTRLAPPTQAPLDTVQLWSQNSERPELMPLTVLNDGSSPVFMNPIEASSEGWDPFALPAEINADPALPPAPTMDEVPLVMNALPRVPTAAQDPFMAMAQRWNTETLQTLRSEDFMGREATDPFTDSKTPSAQPMRSLDELLNSQFIQAPDFNNRMDASTLPTQDAASFDMSSFQLPLEDLGSSSNEAGGDLSGRNPDQSFMSQDSNSMFAPTQGPASSNKAFTIETAAAPQAPSAPISHQQLQDILDKSSMLIKDGGGSIRLDLGSKEMGPLDLALDIKDKTVELRIVAHSDQARETLVQELPKLRESLQNQNLNLEKVEIGVSYGSAWSQSSGNGQQNREQFFENRSESSSRGPNGIRSTSRSYRQSTVSAPEARVPLHNGLIQVRV